MEPSPYIFPFTNKLEFNSSHLKLEVCDNWLSSLANIKLDLDIWLNPKPPLSKPIIPFICSKLKLKLFKLAPFNIKLELILILLTFNVFVSKSI